MALALQQRRERNLILGNPHGLKPFTAEARQQWLPADVSGHTLVPARAVRIRCDGGVGRYAPKSGLV